MTKKQKIRETKTEIVIIGLGYVGLNLAIELNKFYKNIIGYDLSEVIDNYKNNTIKLVDTVTKEDFNNADIKYITDLNEVPNASVYIFTVPTPVHKDNSPDLRALMFSSINLAMALKQRTINITPVICYESTVFPGTTETICSPIFEGAGLVLNKDFYIAYSPERINPGDKEHTINNIAKIISSDNQEAIDILAKIYSSFIDYNNGGDIIVTDSIITAEASKMYENCQRDVLIALANEHAMIYDKLGVDTSLMFKLAQTRWNFSPYFPGLVGGHCIPVDPYYMINLIENKGKMSCNMLKTARETNENVPIYLANIIFDLIRSNINKDKTEIKIGILGVAYKPEISDIRNSKIIDVVNELMALGHYRNFIFHDPYASTEKTKSMYNIELSNISEFRNLDVLIIATAHNEYVKNISGYAHMFNSENAVLVDINGCCTINNSDNNIVYWKYFGCR